MVFSSLMFLFVYLPVTLAVYYLAPLRARNLVLLLVSLLFYGWGEPVYIAVMVASVAINYAFGLLVEKYRADDKKARRIVLSSVLFNLALLFFFKYFDFAVENLRRVPALSGLRPLGLALPIGISFYTFQTMSYTIDVYRGQARTQRNIVSFGAFVTLFPQLIAGPILQYRDVDKQLTGREHSAETFASGVEIFCVGLAKKVLLANSVGALWSVYKAMDPASLTALGAWMGVLAFSFQIYFDFSGYSDMAVGLGRMFGFEFMRNFNYPYVSRSVTEFWRRWHISLGSWFRNYVYIPLGGNRRGVPRQLVNILVVWAATGFWHGASWNFLLWGLYFAALLMLEKLFLLKWLEKAPRALQHAYALFFIVIGWALFGLEDLNHCASYLAAMFGGNRAGLWSALDGYELSNYAALLPALVIGSTPLMASLFGRLSARAKGAAALILSALALILCTAYLVDATYNPFLYFRF